jgi:hypothetical protein
VLRSQANKDALNSHSPHGVNVGDIVDEKVGVLVGYYDFAVQGGAVGVVNLLKDLTNLGSTLVLPSGAIIKQVAVQILTAFTSTGGTGTVALTANSSGDLLAAVDADTLSGVSAGIPAGAAANMVVLTAERTLKLAIATAAITAGKCAVYVEYYFRK